MAATSIAPWGRVTTFPGGSVAYAPPTAGGGAGDTGLSAAYAVPGQFANALADSYGSLSGGMANAGKSFGDAFGAYSAALASMNQSRVNEDSNRRSAAAMAEAARQGALGSIGSASLGAYGSAANSALAAWAANQQSYNQALANMQNADQQALSNLGVSRNTALGQLGDAYGTIGKAQIGSNALSNLNFNFSGTMPGFGGDFGGGGGMTASGPDGTIATGSYGPGPVGGGGGGGGFSLTGSGSRSSSSSQTGDGGAGALAGLAGLRQDLMSGDVLDRVGSQARSGAGRLDAQHYSSRGMPSEMLGQTLSGLMQLQGPAYGESRRGMNQFYDSQRGGSGDVLGSLMAQLASGYADARGDIRGVSDKISSGFSDVRGNLNSLWDRSLGSTPVYQTPLQRARNQWAVDDATKERRNLASKERRAKLDEAANKRREMARRGVGITKFGRI